MHRLLLHKLSNVLYISVAEKCFGLWNRNSTVFRILCLLVVQWWWNWFVYRPVEGATEELEKKAWGNGSSGIDSSTDRRDQSKDSIVDPEMSTTES